jgi:hypothetical protein
MHLDEFNDIHTFDDDRRKNTFSTSIWEYHKHIVPFCETIDEKPGILVINLKYA